MLALFILTLLGISPVAAFWLFSALISTAPSVEELQAVGTGPGKLLMYKWAYNLAHFIAGNIAHIAPSLRISAGGGNGDSK